MSSTVAVLGAGMVGVSCALELQRRGHQVTLVDRLGPGRETSYGNAGVLARSSLIPFNNPGLWASLPTLLKNRTAQFRYNPAFLARHPGWGLGFLARAPPMAGRSRAKPSPARQRLDLSVPQPGGLRCWAIRARHPGSVRRADRAPGCPGPAGAGAAPAPPVPTRPVGARRRLGRQPRRGDRKLRPPVQYPRWAPAAGPGAGPGPHRR